jgi:hypothetical protein
VRLGYVNWLPKDLAARAPAAARLLVDAWVAPSHAQVARVADGSLDLAICWVPAGDLEEHGLGARLIGADRLYAVSAGTDTTPVRARDVIALLDDDERTWSSWNIYADCFARETGARALRISDGGIVGAAFHDHVRELRRPVLNSTKAQDAALPPDLVARPVIDPIPYWTWSLVWRRAQSRPAVTATVDALAAAGGEDFGIHAPDAWLPEGDLHRR